ncbi:MAG TPA: type I glyceraldehyde-3-phosphate dehydrogenase [Bacteroidia bacterium]|nr:type I glyceraldehyde-3-phosphate dehydrogenase [Bacteroidia bacterium]HNT79146.1 type I glyceraldehyde-3-phosphate dehydrogenase [Bacteroidia bacterium]
MNIVKVGINGFGRIGRNFFRQSMHFPQIEICGINDLADTKTLAHLLKYDSVHGIFRGEISHDENNIIINGIKIPCTSLKDPSSIPWASYRTQIVLESTGKFRKTDEAKLHLKAGAKKVIISAPSDGHCKSIVLGVNEQILDGSENVISNASCTTNNAAPMISILNENFGVESAYITTVHAFTGDQNLHDAPHKDLRRARAAALSIIPTTTGAAKAITEIFPELKDCTGGAGIRVPVPNGSLTDITCILKKETNIDQINNAFKTASEGRLKSILQYTEDPIVSIDVVGNTHSCIFDSQLTSVIGRMAKVVGWYDNEMGYSTRLLDLIAFISK